MKVRLNIYRSLFESHLRFASLIYGSVSDTKLHEILLLQKKAVRYVANSYYRAHTDPLFANLKILKIQDLILLVRASLIHQYRTGYLPDSFHRKYFQYISLEDSKRRDDPLCLIVPPAPFKNIERSPYVLLCRDWNTVPFYIKSISKHSDFKKALTDHLLSKYNEICCELNCRACIFGATDFTNYANT